MNNAEFRKWVETLTQDHAKQAGVKSLAKLKVVCFVLANYGDFGTGTVVKPSLTTVAKGASVSRPTVIKIKDWLVKIGVLERTGTAKDNVAVYQFGEVVNPTLTTKDLWEQFQLSIQGRQLLSEDRLSIWTDWLSILGCRLSILEGRLSIVGLQNSKDNTKDSKEDSSKYINNNQPEVDDSVRSQTNPKDFGESHRPSPTGQAGSPLDVAKPSTMDRFKRLTAKQQVEYDDLVVWGGMSEAEALDSLEAQGGDQVEYKNRTA